MKIRTKKGNDYNFFPNFLALSGALLVAVSRKNLQKPQNFLTKSLEKRMHVIETDIGRLVLSGQSLIRWGDGDTMSAFGLSNNYERSSRKLASELREILKGPLPESCLLGMPYEYLLPVLRRNHPSSQLKKWVMTLVIAYKLFPKSSPVYDSFCFRQNDAIETLVRSIVGRDVIFLGPLSGATLMKTRFESLNMTEVLIPERFAYSSIASIQRELELRIEEFDNPIVIVSGGNTGRVLIWRMATRAQFIDLGQMRPLK